MKFVTRDPRIHIALPIAVSTEHGYVEMAYSARSLSDYLHPDDELALARELPAMQKLMIETNVAPNNGCVMRWRCPDGTKRDITISPPGTILVTALVRH